MKKKITIICCIILLLFNFIFKATYAVETTAPTTGTGVTTPTTQTTTTTTSSPSGGTTALNDMISGTGLETVTGTFTDIKKGKTTITSTTGSEKKVSIWNKMADSQSYDLTLMSVVVFIVEFLNNIPELIVEATDDRIDINKFTIYDLVMGHYDFFNADFSNTKFIDEAKDNSLLKLVYTSVFKYYEILRNLSIALSVFILLYIAIRMAISTLSDRRARYKNMLIGWLTSMFILFTMHLIIVSIPYVVQKVLGILEILAEKMDISTIEFDILSGQRSTLKEGGWNIHIFQALLICSMFIYYELKFIIAYLKRFCEIVFLITVSPLVTVLFSIDKAGDGKAQSFMAWTKELLQKYSIQVVHALTYIVFFAAAGAIAQVMPVLAALFMVAMERAEKMFRNMLGVNDKNFEKARVPILDRHRKR